MIMKAMGMISCDEALANLWAFLDGELGPKDEAALERHLEICRRCFPHYDFQRAYFQYLRDLSARSGAPAAVRHRLLLRIAEQEAGTADGS